jgi:predicted nucleotide-binding protein
MGKRALLAEIEDIKKTMPPRETIRQQTQENHNWFGRVSAAIEKWNPSNGALVKEHLDLFFSNRHVRESTHGLNKLLILLDQAQAELRLETGQMSIATMTPSRGKAFVMLKAIYEKTKNDTRPIDDVTKLDIGLAEEEASAAFHYLKDKGLIRTFSEPYAALINANGIDAIENQATEQEQPVPLANVDASRKMLSRKVLIGHGRSLVWLQLKVFLTERLHLSCDEFNAEAVAGIATADRLQTLLDNAGFAFLVMTAEDTHADNSTHARENVIHEAGLFQGRLGFKRAIILLEDGCAQFSNIHGLSHIGFPKGNLEPILEKVRHVLEREQMLQPLPTPSAGAG